ncbi:MAG: hypothetical protein R2774_03055 [Saprospiraceae bacterium]
MEDISEKFLHLEQELMPYKNIMAQAVDVIVAENVSKYPIIIAHQQDLSMGVPIIEANEKIKWSLHASTLEEFVTKQIIFMENVDQFTKNYKDPEQHICIFVLSELGANFVFLTR